jgi:hypothetical protein
MSNIRRIIGLVLAAAVFSLGTAGCKSAGKRDADHASGDDPKAEYPHKKTEQPKGDHPKH